MEFGPQKSGRRSRGSRRSRSQSYSRRPLRPRRTPWSPCLRRSRGPPSYDFTRSPPLAFLP
ncbi:hypothetical protein BHE74_00007002 [Ensete ventricosum]|uniref:Uncharacterized protein n=1 Tax=Ensete ventricosum TaxID=4639 RepID=A0A427AJA6_ENSVE|nr:hypothetical protein B296_00024646 [Ensete ventricosum]RWW84391.1 hypothetical protein BHE74_00007002 [Ensete ventricosum]RZR70484.1 hypothetical protein BHM03_00000093 [Ensete ventricosum]